MAVFTIKKNDLRPYLLVQLTQDGVAVNITGASGVDIRFRKSDGELVVAPCVVVDQLNGLVEYQWAVGDLDVSGEYALEFVVNWPGSKPQTFPDDEHLSIRVTETL